MLYGTDPQLLRIVRDERHAELRRAAQLARITREARRERRERRRSGRARHPARHVPVPQLATPPPPA